MGKFKAPNIVALIIFFYLVLAILGGLGVEIFDPNTEKIVMLIFGIIFVLLAIIYFFINKKIYSSIFAILAIISIVIFAML